MLMSEAKVQKIRPDIRAITRLVPPSGNLVQGQSELPIDPDLAKAAAEIIAASQNHYGGSKVDVDAKPFQLMISNGGTGALVGIAQSYLTGKSALVFEPYYSYHQRIVDEFGGKTETFELDEKLTFEKGDLLDRCKELISRNEYPLKAII